MSSSYRIPVAVKLPRVVCAADERRRCSTNRPWTFIGRSAAALLIVACTSSNDAATPREPPANSGGEGDREGGGGGQTDVQKSIYGVEGSPACLESGLCWSNPLPVGSNLTSIHGSSSADLWAAGAHGTIIHSGSHGAAWSAVPSGTTENLASIYATLESDAWAVGDRGTVLHWQGSKWEHLDLGTTEALRAVWASAPDDVWVIGGDRTYVADGEALHHPGLVFHYDGHAWSKQESPCMHLTAIAGDGRENVWIAGRDIRGHAGCLTRFDGSSWTAPLRYGLPRSSDFGPTANAMVVSGDDLWATVTSAYDTFVLHVQDGVTRVHEDARAEPHDGMGIALGSDGRLWVGGLRVHLLNEAGTAVHPPATALFVSKTDGELFAAGLDGFVARVDTSTSELAAGATKWHGGMAMKSYVSKDKSVWRLGDGGQAFRFANGTFEPAFRFESTEHLPSLAACDEKDVFVTDDVGLAHYDGTTVTQVSTEKPEELFCNADGVLWGVFEFGKLARFDRGNKRFAKDECTLAVAPLSQLGEYSLSNSSLAPIGTLSSPAMGNVFVSLEGSTCKSIPMDNALAKLDFGTVRFLGGDGVRTWFAAKTKASKHVVVVGGANQKWSITELPAQSGSVTNLTVNAAGRIFGTHLTADSTPEGFEVANGLFARVTLGGLDDIHTTFAIDGRAAFAGPYGAVLAEP